MYKVVKVALKLWTEFICSAHPQFHICIRTNLKLQIHY